MDVRTVQTVVDADELGLLHALGDGAHGVAGEVVDADVEEVGHDIAMISIRFGGIDRQAEEIEAGADGERLLTVPRPSQVW